MKGIILAIMIALYPATCMVTEMDKANDTVTITTATGFDYQFKGIEDWTEGDLVSVIFYNNGTENITDDIILDTRYAGYFEGR